MLAQRELEIQVGTFSIDMARSWATPLFESKGQVDRAGKILADPETAESVDEILTTFKLINNWRAIHSYPLHIAKGTLKDRADKISPAAISAQRLKRLSSISSKLRRNSYMKLTQMQDIGGCRAILPGIDEVRELVEVYEKAIAKNPPRTCREVRLHQQS